jgi:hypothetical protein
MTLAEGMGWVRQKQGPKGMGVSVSTMGGEVER